MAIYLYSALAGWLSWLALLIGGVYPFDRQAATDPRPYIIRLQPHYWIMFCALAGALIHAFAALRMPRMDATSTTGIWLATAALVLILAQACLGLLLQYPFRGRRHVRRIHLWTGIALIPLLAAHVTLN